MKARDDTTAVIDSTLAGGPRVLHIGVEPSTVPRRLAQEHDREVECLRWPVEPSDEQWGPEADLAERADEWMQPFLVAPVDVVVVEDVLDNGPPADAFFRTLGSGALVPGGLVVVAGGRDLSAPIQSAGFTLEGKSSTEDGRHVTVARLPSFTTARPQSLEAEGASAAENRRLAHELERTRELLARERATIAREMQLGKDELLAMDRQVDELQDRLQRLRHKNVLLRARVAQVARERDLAEARATTLSEELFLSHDSRAVRAVAAMVERARRRQSS